MDRGCALVGYRVHDSERYGVAEMDAEGRILSIDDVAVRAFVAE